MTALVTSALMLLFLAVSTERSFVDTAPLNEGISASQHQASSLSSQQDADVQDLENLKHSLGKTLAMMKSQSSVYTNINGEEESHLDKAEQVNANGKLVSRVNQHVDSESNGPDGKPFAKLQTDVNIPSKGIHQSVVQQLAPEYHHTLTQNGNRRSPNVETFRESGNSVDKYNTFSGIQYSPLDMAEYVFWTGDEKGVTLAIEEFLQEGLMTREEAISFLQEIKYNLDYLKNHYTQLGFNAKEHSKNQETLLKYSNSAKNQRQSAEKPELSNSFDINQLRQEVNKKSEPEPPRSKTVLSKSADSDKVQNEDYDELLERLRVADFLYTEYSLEEVIYQLAKVMFTQSLTRGSAEAQQALQKFTNFLEMEAEQGHISRALEKKVLDVLIASLSDTLTEHPDLLATARVSLGGASASSSPLSNADDRNFLKQILELSPDDDKAAVRVALVPYDEQNSNNMRHPQSHAINELKVPHVPLDLEKYKNP